MNDSTHPIDLQLFAGEPDASAGEPEVREEEVPAAASAEAAEAAEHQEELPDSVRSTVSIFGAVRGVGGPDTGKLDCVIDGREKHELEFCLYL